MQDHIDDVMAFCIYVVMWSFKIVVCNNDCDLKSCKNVDDYIKNLDECRGTAAVYRYTTAALSFIPLTGIGNFYSARKFDAVFEIIEGIIAFLTVCCCCAYCCDDLRGRDDDNPLLGFELLLSFLLAVVSIVRCIMCTAASIENFDLLELLYHYEFYLSMVTVVISLIFCCCGCAERKCWIASAILNVIVVAVMEIIRDVYMAINNENDGNGCPFI